MRCSKILAALALALFFVGCSKDSTPNLQALRINIASDPATLDPRRARDLNEVTICRMLFEGLTRTSKEGKTELALAEAVEISDDGLEYVFHLRSAFWSNGDPVTSFDFAESWKSTLSPLFPSDIAYQLYLIQNGQKVKAGEMGPEKLGIQTPNAETLIVRLEQPTPYFLEVCAMSSYFPVPRQASDKNWALDPGTFVGNGPFLLKSWTHADQIAVAKNHRYWESKAVRLQEIDLMMMSNDTEIRMFEEKKLDWAGSPLSTIPVDAVKHLKETHQLKVSPLSGTSFLRVNTADNFRGKQNPLSKAGCRKALAMAVDRTGITDHILQGGQTPARSLVPKEMGLFGSGYFFDQNPEEAKAIIAESLQEMGIAKEQMQPIILSFIVDDRNLSIAQAIQKHWETSLGILVQLEAVEKKVFYQRIRQKDFQLALGSWIADFNDPINFLEVFKFKLGSTNNTHWENPKYIDLLNRSQLCRDQEERKGLLRQAEEILMLEMPIIPIFHYAMNYLEQSGVEDVALSPIGVLDFRWAQIR
jgi:oligopeptide transport system substrate-binding protein